MTLQQLQATLRRDDRRGGSESLGIAWVQASASLGAGETSRDVRFTLKPGQTYVLVSEVVRQNQNSPPARAFSTFTTGTTANGATLPRADARVRMAGLRFRGSAVLPRRGVVRVSNVDGVPHFAIAFPLRSTATRAQFGRALRANDERALERLVAGAPVAVQGLMSGGGTSNDQQVRFSRRGRYGLVCFFDEHHRLGMYRVVRVR